MGKQLGELGHSRGQIVHGLSPLEQKPFYGALKKGIPNFARRFKMKYLLIGVRKIVFGGGESAFVYNYYRFYTGRALHKELQRKDMAEFENEA